MLFLSFALQVIAKKHRHLQDPLTEIGKAAAEKAAQTAINKFFQNPQQVGAAPVRFLQGRLQSIEKFFTGNFDIGSRRRNLQLTIINGLPQSLYFQDAYFDSGDFYSSFESQIAPNTVSVAFVASRQGSWFTGVTGGIQFRIGNTGKYYYIGFNNPFWGSFKFYYEVTSRKMGARYAYQKSENINNPKKFFGNWQYNAKAMDSTNSGIQKSFVYAIKD